jgi:hypothetical protein
MKRLAFLGLTIATLTAPIRPLLRQKQTCAGNPGISPFDPHQTSPTGSP